MKYIAFIFIAMVLSIFLVDVYATLAGWKSLTAYEGPFLIIHGPHMGRVVSRVSVPYLFNWYNSWTVANVPATKEEIPILFPKEHGWTQESWQHYEQKIDKGMGPRTSVKVRWSDLEPIGEIK